MGLSTVFWRPVNLFRSKETRAASPHTSNWGLVKIFYHGQDNSVKSAVVSNLSRRIDSGKLSLEEASMLPLDLIKKAIINSSYNIKWLISCLKNGTEELKIAAKEFFDNASGLLTGLPENDIVEIVEKGLLPPETIRKTINRDYNIELLRHCLMFGTEEIRSMAEDVIKKPGKIAVQKAIIERLGKEITRGPRIEVMLSEYSPYFYLVKKEALHALQNLSEIVSDSLKPMIIEIFAKYISDLVLKTRKVIDQPAEGHYEEHHEENETNISGTALYFEGGYSMDPSASVFQEGVKSTSSYSSTTVWVETVAEKSHYEYSKNDPERAIIILKWLKPEIQEKVLKVLNRINPTLAEILVRSRNSW
ncbi:MAG: hypothetical protein WC624_00660 [Candidatus Margulisiibacteriota bacterium]